MLNRGNPVDPDLVPPPSLAAYREFVAGLKRAQARRLGEEAEHYRRAARLDSTFVAPLIQLAFRAILNDECSVTDSIGVVLEPRRERLSLWNRHDHRLAARPLPGRDGGGVAASRAAVYGLSPVDVAQTHYARALQFSNQPRAAREILRRMDPERDLGWWNSPEEVWPRYWWRMAATWHMAGRISGRARHHRSLARFGDSEWQVVRGRALSALGREREVMELLRSTARGSADLVAVPQLTIATSSRLTGIAAAAMAVAESILARLELRARHGLGARAEYRLGEPAARSDGAGAGSARADCPERCRHAGQAGSERPDRGAARRHCQAERIDSILARAEQPPLEEPTVRGPQILARAHIAAGFGRREQAVALLRDASARGLLELGSSHAFHADPLLAPLRGYPPFDALLKPDN